MPNIGANNFSIKIPIEVQLHYHHFMTRIAFLVNFLFPRYIMLFKRSILTISTILNAKATSEQLHFIDK